MSAAYDSIFSTSASSTAFAYTQPSLVSLLILCSFIYLLNVVRVIADFVLHAGIVAQIGLGIVYGTPLAGLLPDSWEAAFTVVGYLGLVGIVFEGGLSTNLHLLLSNLPMSILCALTGIGLPVAFSFALLTAGYGYKPLEAFAAGAALSSTSLGTTLAALNSVSSNSARFTSEKDTIGDYKPTNLSQVQIQPVPTSSTTPPGDSTIQQNATASSAPLQQTRIGTILISAAVIDDVIGLVLASLIPTLSTLSTSSSPSNLAWIIARPLVSSSLMALLTPLVAQFVLRPAFRFRGVGEQWCAPGAHWGSTLVRGVGRWGTEQHADAVKLLLMVVCVSAFAAIANYTGSSVLFGAYLAGLTLTYVMQPATRGARGLTGEPAGVAVHESGSTPSETTKADRGVALSFEHAYARTVGPLQQYMLAPLFFASIGYAISAKGTRLSENISSSFYLQPFRSLWRPTILWKGVLYAILMCAAKLAVGLPIIIYSVFLRTEGDSPHIQRNRRCLILPRSRTRTPDSHTSQCPTTPPAEPLATINTHRPSQLNLSPSHSHPPYSPPAGSPLTRVRSALAPAAFIGVAMVSRGEIGLLVAQIAHQGEGSDDGLLGEEAFLVCMWAILLCTLVGPIGVGGVVRRWGSRVAEGMWR